MYFDIATAFSALLFSVNAFSKEGIKFMAITISMAIWGAFIFLAGCIYTESKEKDEDEPSRWIHCFNCEIEMPVKEYKGKMYCANCKLIHRISKEECKHITKVTEVLNSSATCETTIEVCADCNKRLTEPKTDCV